MSLTKAQEEKIKKARPDILKNKYYSEHVSEWWDKYGKKEMPGYFDNYNSLADEVLAQTPRFREVKPTFEEYYSAHPALEKEDYTQAKALMEPYYQTKIADTMEDLNAWATNEKVNYTRTLRRARASYAARNTGIGTARQRAESEMESDYQRGVQEKVKGTERQVGTEAIQGEGYSPYYQGREGDIIGTMKEKVEEQQQWHKTQRQNRYNTQLQNYYKQEGNTNWLGQSI